MTIETGIFVAYLAFMLSIGIYFFIKNKNADDKAYFLGNRQMGPWVSALSAGASDMSAWVLMGLPTSIYAFGLGQVWISVGLAIGYAISWIYEAPRLRSFSIVADDSITIPQYLTNRFRSASRSLQVICAAIFLFAYTIYAASSIKACGTLFNTVLGLNESTAMYVAALIIIGYTLLGGFSAVCWTDFFQGMLMLGALLAAPLFAFALMDSGSGEVITDANYFSAFASWKDIVSGLGWGLGYFGMPHIIIRYMSLESQASLKKSARIGISWTTLIVIFAALLGISGRMFLGYDEAVYADSLVFIKLVRLIFPAAVSGILLSAVLAAAMSTADSQLLAAASAFAADVYKPILRKGSASEKEMSMVNRLVVAAIAAAALLIASDPGAGSVMSLVSNAWGIFGAAFGPAIMLSLYWKRFTFGGAVASILVGAGVDIFWLYCLSSTGIYEIIPGFAAGLAAAVIVSLMSKEPGTEVEALFDAGVAYKD